MIQILLRWKIPYDWKSLKTRKLWWLHFWMIRNEKSLEITLGIRNLQEILINKNFGCYVTHLWRLEIVGDYKSLEFTNLWWLEFSKMKNLFWLKISEEKKTLMTRNLTWIEISKDYSCSGSGISKKFYLGVHFWMLDYKSLAKDTDRPRTLDLAKACSLMSALSKLSPKSTWAFLNLAKLRAAISSASSICLKGEKEIF